MEWQARVHRLTLFPSSVTESASWPSWQDLTGEAADTKISRLGIEQEEGNFGVGRLTLVKQLPLRIDVLYSSEATSVESPEGGPLTLGALKESLPTFTNMARRCVTQVAVQRLAIGTVVAKQASDRLAAYDMLAKEIRSTTFNFANAQEFLYQINRPRNSTIVSGLAVNRLSRWSAAKLMWTAVNGGTGRSVSTLERVFATLETDVNTAADRAEPFAAAAAVELFDELVHLTLEITESGDVP